MHHFVVLVLVVPSRSSYGITLRVERQTVLTIIRDVTSEVAEVMEDVLSVGIRINLAR